MSNWRLKLFVLLYSSFFSVHVFTFTVNNRNPFQIMESLPNMENSTHGDSKYNWALLSLRPKACRPKHRFESDEDLFRCPSPDKSNLLYWPCIRNGQICNGIPDCPNGEDEHPAYCMFHLAEMRELQEVKKILASAFASSEAKLKFREHGHPTIQNPQFPPGL